MSLWSEKNYKLSKKICFTLTPIKKCMFTKSFLKVVFGFLSESTFNFQNSLIVQAPLAICRFFFLHHLDNPRGSFTICADNSVKIFRQMAASIFFSTRKQEWD